MKSTYLTDPKTATRISVHPPSTHLQPHCETPRPTQEVEGVTGFKCLCCNGAGYLRLDQHHAEQCPFC